MKRCPGCRRDYFDDSLLYCLDDGSALLEGPAYVDEPATAVLPAAPASGDGVHLSEAATRAQIHTTTSGSDAAGSGPGRRLLIALCIVIVILVTAGVFGYRYLKPTAADQISSIAVLPFQNRSSDTDTDYLSDGIAESLIYRLSQIADLKVSPVSSVVRYKGKNADVTQVARELGVSAVMSGRLTQRGDNLTIGVELIDVVNNKILWGEQYDRKMSDLLATQREIAATIAQKLQLKLAGSESKGITKKYTDNNDAYQLYLKGRFHFARRSKDEMEKSLELFQQAVTLDANFALAYVGIAETITSMTSYPYISPREGAPRAKAAIAKAMELDPALPEAHTVAGMIAATYDWDYPTAEREFKQSLQLDPNLAITHYRYAWVYLSPSGRHDEAVAEMKRATELEPLSIQQAANFAAVLMYARRFDEAVEQAKKTYELDPTHVGAQSWLAHAYNAKGMYNESLAITENISRSDYLFFGHMGYAYAKLGRRADAEALMKKWAEVSKTRYVMVYWIAVVQAALGNKDAAFAELEKSYEARDWFLQRLKVDPFMDPLRDDPRYPDLVKRLNLPQ